MIQVSVSKELLVQMLTTGYSSHGILTVQDGLPEGAEFQAVWSQGQTIFFCFREGESSTTDVREKDIVVRCEAPDSRPEDLLDRFVDLYGEVLLEGSMIEPGMKLWRDYHEWSGEHMILTEEGWESGSGKAAYIDMLKPGEKISDVILDEVNAPR